MRMRKEGKVSAGNLGKKDEESNEIDISLIVSLILAKISSQNPFPPFRKILPHFFVGRRKFLLVPLSLCEQSLLDIALFSPSSHSSLDNYPCNILSLYLSLSLLISREDDNEQKDNEDDEMVIGSFRYNSVQFFSFL